MTKQEKIREDIWQMLRASGLHITEADKVLASIWAILNSQGMVFPEYDDEERTKIARSNAIGMGLIMTRQEQIREVLDTLCAVAKVKDLSKSPTGFDDEVNAAILELHELGLVLKVERELPKALYYEEEHLDPKWVEEAVKSDMLKWHNDSLEPLIKQEEPKPRDTSW